MDDPVTSSVRIVTSSIRIGTTVAAAVPIVVIVVIVVIVFAIIVAGQQMHFALKLRGRASSLIPLLPMLLDLVWFLGPLLIPD